jgi:hypothetical protein
MNGGFFGRIKLRSLKLDPGRKHFLLDAKFISQLLLVFLAGVVKTIVFVNESEPLDDLCLS